MSELKARAKDSSRLERQFLEETRASKERERALMQALSQVSQAHAPDPMAGIRQALAERGIDENAAPVIAEIAQREARAAASNEVSQLLTPMLRQWQAQGQLEQELGDYPRGKVNKYLNENPRVQARYEAMLSGDPVGAHEYALLKMREATGYGEEAELKESHEEVRRMKQEGRTTGRVLASRGSRERKSPDRDESGEEIARRLDRLREQAVASKIPDHYIRERAKLIPSFSKIKWADSDE